MIKSSKAPYVVIAPKKLTPFIQLLSSTNEVPAQELIEQATAAIYEVGISDQTILPNHIMAAYAQIQDIEPKDTVESTYKAQIFTASLLGEIKLAQNHPSDQRIALNFFKLAHDARARLDKKRQNIEN